MARKWMQKAFANAKGQLHRSLGVPMGQKIPAAKLEAASHKGGLMAKRANLAKLGRRYGGGRKSGSPTHGPTRCRPM